MSKRTELLREIVAALAAFGFGTVFYRYNRRFR